ncbi:MAG TPA: hypothetical protein VK902_13145 [Rubrobacter sp.]|nr:hypothetical protein [Rubrobacter sp.]
MSFARAHHLCGRHVGGRQSGSFSRGNACGRRPGGERKVYPARKHESVDVPLEDLYIGGAPSLYPEVTGKNPFHVDLGKDRLVFRA